MHVQANWNSAASDVLVRKSAQSASEALLCTSTPIEYELGVAATVKRALDMDVT